MSNGKFFQEQQEHSLIKALIVNKYFWSWANVMLAKAQTDRIYYIDLFAGPGRYQDGAKSTPRAGSKYDSKRAVAWMKIKLYQQASEREAASWDV
jgi:three-Cys-motif partner protein